MNMPKPDEKPFAIPKRMVWEAWRQVKANKGVIAELGGRLEGSFAQARPRLARCFRRRNRSRDDHMAGVLCRSLKHQHITMS